VYDVERKPAHAGAELSRLNQISHLPEEVYAAWRMIATGGPRRALEAI
jgi:hypothetical protein